jgi:hypothetical protein
VDSSHGGQYLFDGVITDKHIEVSELLFHLEDLTDEIFVFVIESVQKFAELKMPFIDKLPECFIFF